MSSSLISRAQTERRIRASFPDATAELVAMAADAALAATARALRTDAVDAVLEAVRETGRSAHPTASETDGISGLVFAVAVTRGESPRALQDMVNIYASAMDALTEA